MNLPVFFSLQINACTMNCSHITMSKNMHGYSNIIHDFEHQMHLNKQFQADVRTKESVIFAKFICTNYLTLTLPSPYDGMGGSLTVTVV